MTEISGKTALVTGGGSGLGRGLAIALAQGGARVMLADIRPENARLVADEIARGGGSAIAFGCDVSDRHSVRQLKADAEAAFGPVALLFANAGATSFETMNGISDDEVDWIIQVNLMGVINCVQMFLPPMIEAGCGHIIATSSPAGLIPTLLANHAPYSAAKAGVIGFIENLSLEIASSGVRTTLVYPSNVDTPIGAHNSTYRPQRFGGPFDAAIVPPPGYVRPQLQSADDAAELVLKAVRDDLRMIITGDEFRQRFMDEYVDVALKGFDAAAEHRNKGRERP